MKKTIILTLLVFLLFSLVLATPSPDDDDGMRLSSL
jgi:hypothetical protein